MSTNDQDPRQTIDGLPPGITTEQVRGFRRLMARCWIVAGLLIELPLEDLDRLTTRSEKAGPLLYPEIWRRNAKAIMEDREMIRALTTAQRAVLTTSPSLGLLAPLIRQQADEHQATLEAAFRDLFYRRPLATIPPAAVLTALVRFIADRVPELGPGQP